MNLHTLFLTRNDCYKAGKIFTPKGLFVHSAGANNPYLKRYVGPDDGLLGRNNYENHWNRPMDRQVCVHAFIGKLEDGSIATYQTLPWNMRGWHSGSGPKGNGNDLYLGFEVCEDNLSNATYFRGVWNEAVELCVHLCAMFGFDPMADGVIIGHYEGYRRGIASNHADPRHWFSRYGEGMDSFRLAVKRVLDSLPGTSAKLPSCTPEPESTPTELLPQDPASASVAPDDASHTVHTVARGDTLWRIAANRLGSGVRYAEIKKLNALTSDTVYVGQKLKIPKE